MEDENGDVITIIDPKSVKVRLLVCESLNPNSNPDSTNINSDEDFEADSSQDTTKSKNKSLLPPFPSIRKYNENSNRHSNEIPLNVPVNAKQVHLPIKFTLMEFFEHIVEPKRLTQALVKIEGVYRHIFFYNESYDGIELLDV